MNEQFKVTLTIDLLNQSDLHSSINFLASFMREKRNNAPTADGGIDDTPPTKAPEDTKIVQVEPAPIPIVAEEVVKKTRKPRAPKAEPEADQFEQLANLVLEKFNDGTLTPSDMQAILATHGVKSLVDLKGTDKLGVVYAELLI